MNDDIESIASDLGRVYARWKQFEAQKNLIRDMFFQACTKSVEDDLSIKDVYIEGKDLEACQEKVKEKNPLWDIKSCSFVGRHNSVSTYRFSLIEKPEFKSFAIEANGYIFQKNVSEGGYILDDERIKEEDPILWKRISREKVVEEVIPFDELPEDVLDQLGEYIHRGNPVVKLLAPKKVKDE